MTKILVTGATGLLGSSLVPYLENCNYTVKGVSFSQQSDYKIDLTKLDDIRFCLRDYTPDLVINLAALANVDRCETHPHLADALNTKIVENLCAWINELNQPCHLIHLSTDQIYDGIGPHSEWKESPSNYYAISKLAGEYAARSTSSTILRTNFVGRSLSNKRQSLTDWLYQSLCDQRQINVFDDVLFSPLSIASLCILIKKCISMRPHGVFNLGSRDGMSKAAFAFSFASAVNISPDNFSIVSSSFHRSFVANRPSDMRMDSYCFERHMGLILPTLADEILRVAKDYTDLLDV
ncbi:dTDP-4-dehydrorhamnose reductase family protein [Synechococcus sp. MIT S9452]|uniref:dTDP-4-dehydrorhamnose reductase family protein n=1 Tax=Synechococcus sp. MIT S9452 TaxID=3082546 RepID=UPI0039A743CB